MLKPWDCDCIDEFHKDEEPYEDDEEMLADEEAEDENWDALDLDN